MNTVLASARSQQNELRPPTFTYCCHRDGYAIRVDFEDGVSRDIDLEPVLNLNGALFGPLRHAALFRQVQLDPEAHTVVWPNGADFDPATLDDWPDMAADFEAMARRWDPQAPRAQDPPAG